MGTYVTEPLAIERKPTREEARAIGARLKARRRLRTARLRKTVAVVAVAAFIGPFGVIYTQMADGHDPSLASRSHASVAPASSPSLLAPVTTQQS